MVGNTPYLTTPVAGAATVSGDILYIPLEFFWNRNPGLALPLIALQYHEVKINLELNDAKNCYWSGTVSGVTPTTTMTGVTVPSLTSCSLFVDYVYLDTDERRRRLQMRQKGVCYEYLGAIHRNSFDHPVCLQHNDNT
jgi:hypothetical protein